MTNFWTKLNKPFTALAPMEDVTEFVFREILSDIAKPDVLFTEFTCTDALFTKGHDAAARRLLFSQKQKPIVAQIWGATPEHFTQAAEFIAQLGFDGIDINMGCPAKDVIRKKSGAALIKHINLADQLIKTTLKGAPNIPVSVKTRLGKDREETTEWVSFLLTSGVTALTIHGRDTKSMSKGSANWDEIGYAVELKNKINPQVLIIGNGDVASYQEVLDKHDKYKVDGVMIGRGVFKNPWVFDKNPISINHSREEYVGLLLKHTKLFCDTWGTNKNFETLKKFFKVYIKDFKGADTLRTKLMSTQSYTEVKRQLGKFKYRI